MKTHLIAHHAGTGEKEALSDEFFLKRNVIKLWGPVTDEMANFAISSLLYLDYCFEAQDIPRCEREINIWINSPGGSVSAGLAIYDAMNFVQADIRTTCIGMAASMGAFLLSAGTYGKREALPHSEVLIHQPLGGTQGQATDIEIHARHIIKTKEKMAQILAERTGQPLEKVKADCERDYYLSAEEAKAYGLVDEVVAPNKKRK